MAETEFKPPIERPAFASGEGPVVLNDDAPLNSHTAAGRYLPFAERLRRDGDIVEGPAARFTRATLDRGQSS